MPQRLIDLNAQMLDCETIIMYTNYLAKRDAKYWDADLIAATVEKHFELRKKYSRMLSELAS